MKVFSVLRRGLVLSALALSFAPSSLGQPAPKLDAVARVWFQRGTTNETSFTGEALGGIREVLVSGGGVSVFLDTQVAPGTTLEGSAGGLSTGPVDSAKSVSIKIVADGKASLGPREVRVAGPNGVSNPLTIQVSDMREILEPRPNQTLEEAPWIEMPVSISGVISANAESDYFRFKARAGEKLIFDVQANRTGSPLDPAIEVLDAQGKELAKNEDTHGLDPFLEFTVPEDGDYALKVHDLRFQSGADYRYRLVAGRVPYLDYLFPFGGRRGTSIDLQMRGRNLDGAEKISLRIAPDAPLGIQEVRAHSSRGYSNPLPFQAGDLPEMMESEPNNANDKASPVAVPIVINGLIGEAKDQDVFKFKAEADQAMVLEVLARRFGSPLDALLTLMDAKGTVLQRNDDADGLDARIQFDAKKEAEYFVSIRDLTDRGGERFGYRLSIRKTENRADFAVRMTGARYRVFRGGSVPVRCEIDRKNGFDGLVRVSAQGLPAGVSASPLVFGSGANFAWLVLTASADAEPGYRPLKLQASSAASGEPVLRDAQAPEQAWITVLPNAPFVIDAAPGSLVAEQNTKATVDVSVVRRAGFSGEVKISAEELPGIKVSTLTLSPGQPRGKLELEVKYDAEAGTRPLVIRGEASVDGFTVSNHAPLPVTITTHRIAMFLTAMLPGSSFFRTDPVKLSAVALPAGGTSQANATEFVVKIDRRDMTNEVALVLEGLPEGVLATVTNIVSGANEAPIKLLVTDKAAAGKQHQFTVVGTVTHGDRIWRQKTQPITLSVEASAKEPATASVAPAKP